MGNSLINPYPPEAKTWSAEHLIGMWSTQEYKSSSISSSSSGGGGGGGGGGGHGHGYNRKGFREEDRLFSFSSVTSKASMKLGSHRKDVITSYSIHYTKLYETMFIEKRVRKNITEYKF